MNTSDIENSIVRYLTNEATVTDLEFLSDWIKDPQNEELFSEYVKVHYEVSLIMGEPDVEKIKQALLAKIENDLHPVRRLNYVSVLKYAAAIFILFGVSYFYVANRGSIASEDVIVDQNVIEQDNNITIRLDDGSTKTLDSESDDVITDDNGNLIGTQRKSQLTYENSEVEQLVFNTLQVPHGKRFDVILSDGTHVYLNAGTSLKYPVKFLSDNPRREVFLNGEAYFDVSENPDQPFIVHANTMNVRVLGTGFNVSNYSNESSVQTVLVNGSVELFDDKTNEITSSKRTVLKPGNKAEWNKNNKNIDVKIVDPSIYTAWKEGKLIFRNAAFLTIRKKLERHYNVEIVNNNNNLDVQLFDATFDIETIEEVLETFSRSYKIDYTINNNKIIIN